tara:strand:- start:962 stop:1360 length:399 start_codon:yes stop_codon:yes gene_type:complete
MVRKDKTAVPHAPDSPKLSKKKTPPVAAEVATKQPEWFSLYRIMAEASDKLINSIILRKDIPEDAKEILRAALTIREVRELCWAEGGSLTPKTACFWASELAEWAMTEVDIKDIPLTQSNGITTLAETPTAS